MADAAVASVVVAGVAVVTSGVVAVVVPLLTARRTASLTRENRIQQRLADSYLDMLKIVEREGLWLRAQLYNIEAAVREDEYDPIPRMHPPQPELSDQATIAALLATFGSKQVRERHAAWREGVVLQKQQYEILRWNHQEAGDPMGPPEEVDVQRLQSAHAAQVVQRQALADAVADELGHR